MNIKVSREEFMEKYGDVMVVFDGYYKYTFTYKGDTQDGLTVYVSCGGSADEIYRREVVPDKEERVEDLYPDGGTVYRGASFVEEFYEESFY